MLTERSPSPPLRGRWQGRERCRSRPLSKGSQETPFSQRSRGWAKKDTGQPAKQQTHLVPRGIPLPSTVTLQCQAELPWAGSSCCSRHRRALRSPPVLAHAPRARWSNGLQWVNGKLTRAGKEWPVVTAAFLNRIISTQTPELLKTQHRCF